MKKQGGFTLIELIMVIVILGILAATALPKFANLQGDARAASIQAAGGAVKSAMAIVHAQSLIDGNETTAAGVGVDVTLEGSTITLDFGYPTIADIDTAAGLNTAAGGDYLISAGGVISLDPAVAGCDVTYVEAVDANTPATATINTANC